MNTKIAGTLMTICLGISAWAGAQFPIAEGDSVFIDDFADGNYTSNFGPWEISTDTSSATTFEKSIVQGEESFNFLRVDYTLAPRTVTLPPSGIQMTNPFIEIKVLLDEGGNPVDLSSCTEIHYDYRSTGTMMMGSYSFGIIGGENADTLSVSSMPGVSGWIPATIKWSNFEAASINDIRQNVLAFRWKMQSVMMGSSSSGTFDIANIRCLNRPLFMVKFYRGDQLLYSQEYARGDSPWYPLGTSLGSSDKYDYRIVGWEPELAPVTAAASYQAIVDSTIRSYEITFKSEDGSRLLEQELEYGTIPSYAGLEPTKLPTVGYTYTFKGWGEYSCGYVDKQYCEDYGDDEPYCYTEEEYECGTKYFATLPPVTKDAEYRPVFDSTANIYTVKFVDYDGRVLSESQYAYGTKANGIAIPRTPSRAPNGDVIYVFNGWLPSVSDVRGNAVYVADYSAQREVDGEMVDAELYTVTFVNGSEVLQVGEYEAGAYPEYTGETPTKDSTEELVYYFYDWEDQNGWGIENVEENKIYTALFDSRYRQYWIVFVDDDGSVLDSVQMEYGDRIYSPDVNTKSYNDGFDFEGWTPEFKRVTGRAVYQAKYRYRVLWGEDGYYGSDWCSIGEVPDGRYVNPSKQPTSEYTYEFVGWDRELAPVTDTTTYRAVFVKQPLPKAYTVNVAEGESWLVDDLEDGDETTLQGGTWFVYDDNGEVDDDGTPYHSEISKMVALNGDSGNVMSILHKMECWDRGNGRIRCRGWLGAGLTLAAEGAPVDLSQCNAIQYDYRGTAHRFKVESLYDDEDEDYLRTVVNASETWTTATIYRSDLD